MKDKDESSPKEGSKDTIVSLTVEVSIEDMERIRQAFAEGKLRALGVTNIVFPSAQDIESGDNDWSKREADKSGKQSCDNKPSR
jgi:hypothetical protein